MRRRLALATLSLTTLGCLVVVAEGATPKAASHAPTVAYQAGTALVTGKQPANKRVTYTGSPLRFASATTPRGMGEPTLGVTKRGTVYTTTIEFDGPGGATGTTVIYSSRDGGRTFKALDMGLGGTKKNPATLDPYVYVDPDYGRAFSVDLAGAGSLIHWTDDTGESQGDGFATVGGANDHQTLTTAVPPKGNPLLVPSDPSFPKIVYYCVNTIARVACAHSLDGGRTYVENGTSPSKAASATGGIICGSLHGHIVSDRDGRLFLPRNECDKMILGVSEDGGLTWTDRVVSADFPGMDPDASVAADKDGNLYYVWYDGARALPYLSVSRNHGVSWSKPVMIAPPGVTEAWFPVIDVGDPGKIAVWFMGSSSTSKADKLNTRPWNMYAAVSTNALQANPTFVSTFTNKPGDPIHRGDCGGRCGTVFDFLDLVSAPNDSGRLWGVAVDTCTKICAEDDDVRGNSDETDSYGKSGDNVGFVFRQVSGPALRGTKPIAADTRR